MTEYWIEELYGIKIIVHEDNVFIEQHRWFEEKYNQMNDIWVHPEFLDQLIENLIKAKKDVNYFQEKEETNDLD